MPYIKQKPLQEAFKAANANLQSTKLTPFDQREYMILYNLAAAYTTQCRDCVFVLRQIPEAVACAHSIRLARKNGEKAQSKKMITRLRSIIKEAVFTLKLDKVD